MSPNTVKEAYDIDRQSGTDFWTKDTAKEMKLVSVTPDGMRKGNIMPGYEHTNVYMIFDINMDRKFTRKSILVAVAHTTAPPSSITYSSVVSRESVRIAFLLASLNDLDIFEYDIGKKYLNKKVQRETLDRSRHIVCD